MAASMTDSRPCCECVLRLRPSSLREPFYAVCEYLNRSAWAILCRYFLKIRFLEKEDMDAIGQASKLSRATPSQELVLRLEKKRNMTVDKFLSHVKSACDDVHFRSVASMYGRLHTKDCPVLSLTIHFGPSLLFQSCPLPDGQAKEPRPCQPKSMNNLSDPFKPYLHITMHPSNQTLKLGEDLLLKCVAESDAAISYSWLKDGCTLDGYNNKILMIPDIQYSDQGVYSCLVQTNALKVVSGKATVNIVLDPTVESLISYYATEKYALLIANERYLNSIPTLSSASNDVCALAKVLQGLQFKTVTLLNLTLTEMSKAVELFCRNLVSGAYCVTYLAGHGFENDGQCYIVPVDAPRKYTAEKCFSIKKMIENIRSSCNLGLAVFLLDVCRKRLHRSESVARPNYSTRGMSGNFVISYATMEHGIAYEVEGHKLGVYTSSLIKHLHKDELITRVLELAHRDIHKNDSTRASQQPEFSSNIFEDRKLTDPLHARLSGNEQTKRDSRWHEIHYHQKPNIYIFESCGAEVEVTKLCHFSNVFSIEAHIKEMPYHYGQVANVMVALKGYEATSKQLLIENVQRLHNKDLTFQLLLYSTSGEVVDQYEDCIEIPFVSWWKGLA